MKKIGIFYSFNTNKTSKVAEELIEEFKGCDIEAFNAENITGSQLLAVDNLIIGSPTWFDGELPNYWDEFGPELETLDLKDKRVALFGLGDQIGYSENFLDAIGILADLFESRGAKIVGYTSTEGYTYEKSKALKNDHFTGLGIDFENQAKLNKERIKNWVTQLKSEFV
jgi:flavodoxin I